MRFGIDKPLLFASASTLVGGAAVYRGYELHSIKYSPRRRGRVISSRLEIKHHPITTSLLAHVDFEFTPEGTDTPVTGQTTVHLTRSLHILPRIEERMPFVGDLMRRIEPGKEITVAVNMKKPGKSTALVMGCMNPVLGGDAKEELIPMNFRYLNLMLIFGSAIVIFSARKYKKNLAATHRLLGSWR